MHELLMSCRIARISRRSRFAGASANRAVPLSNIGQSAIEFREKCELSVRSLHGAFDQGCARRPSRLKPWWRRALTLGTGGVHCPASARRLRQR